MTAQCNLCGGTAFEDFRGRVGVRCSQCGSLERTRMIALFVAQMRLPSGARVLHIAPEEGLYNNFRRRPEIADYVVADYAPELYKFVTCTRIDLCNLESWPSDHFDLILHSHVLEHTRCNIAYTLYHLHRMLTPQGRHVFVIPFTTGSYDESFQKMGTEERTRRFGQWDHLRRFGVVDIGDHIGKIVRMPSAFDATALFGTDALDQAHIPVGQRTGFHGSTVIDLAKDDYLLRPM